MKHVSFDSFIMAVCLLPRIAISCPLNAVLEESADQTGGYLCLSLHIFAKLVRVFLRWLLVVHRVVGNRKLRAKEVSILLWLGRCSSSPRPLARRRGLAAVWASRSRGTPTEVLVRELVH
jgi:hypothetical protein